MKRLSRDKNLIRGVPPAGGRWRAVISGTRVGMFGPVLADAPFVGFIPVRDLATARDFYEGTLGLRVLDESPFALVLDAGGTMLRVTLVPDPAARPFTIAGWKVPDINAEVRTLAGRGIQFARYDGMTQDDLGIWTAPGGDRVAWFKDPDGNTLSLTTFAAP